MYKIHYIDTHMKSSARCSLYQKYCISTLTVNCLSAILSTAHYCTGFYQLYLHYIDSERPLPLVCCCHRIVSTVFYIPNSARKYTVIGSFI